MDAKVNQQLYETINQQGGADRRTYREPDCWSFIHVVGVGDSWVRSFYGHRLVIEEYHTSPSETSWMKWMDNEFKGVCPTRESAQETLETHARWYKVL